MNEITYVSKLESRRKKEVELAWGHLKKEKKEMSIRKNQKKSKQKKEREMKRNREKCVTNQQWSLSSSDFL